MHGVQINLKRTIYGGSLLAAERGDERTAGTQSSPTVRKPGVDYPRIATEEAFQTPDLRALYREFTVGNWSTLDAKMFGVQADDSSPLANDLVDLDQQRLKRMDEAGVAMHLLSLTTPGVQLLRAGVATEFAREANDYLADAIRRHPTRYCGLAAVAPQDPSKAVQEMERSIRTLKLNGFIINSHTDDEYLDLKKYWPVLEAAEALDRPIYIHPRAPSSQLAEAFDLPAMSGPLWGFNTEVSVHVMRLFCAGVFQQFPNLKIVIGHMGEAFPFYLWRCDWAAAMGKLPYGRFSEVFRRNVAITTSGAADFGNGNASAAPALECAIKAVGVENVIWAVDYPYQPMAPGVAFMDRVDVSEADREAIYHLNAKRVFHIEQEPELLQRAGSGVLRHNDEEQP
jgi:2,3-dihydroxybenzoate decarboxylase/5-carboxyvanillate decarboxylase